MRPVERLPEVILGGRGGSGCALQQQKVALDACQLGHCPLHPSAGSKPMSAPLLASWTDRVDRIWIMDLRQQSFTELGGTARPRNIWRQVGRHLETTTVPDHGEPALMPDQARWFGKQRAISSAIAFPAPLTLQSESKKRMPAAPTVLHPDLLGS